MVKCHQYSLKVKILIQNNWIKLTVILFETKAMLSLVAAHSSNSEHCNSPVSWEFIYSNKLQSQFWKPGLEYIGSSKLVPTDTWEPCMGPYF